MEAIEKEGIKQGMDETDHRKGVKGWKNGDMEVFIPVKVHVCVCSCHIKGLKAEWANGRNSFCSVCEREIEREGKRAHHLATTVHNILNDYVMQPKRLRHIWV